ncbi:MAG: hypothetical protein ABIG60_01830 [Patescibacteria group bacterium]
MKKILFVLVLVLAMIFPSLIFAEDRVDVRRATGFLHAFEKGFVISEIVIVEKDILLYDDQRNMTMCFNFGSVTLQFTEENGEVWLVIQVAGRNTTDEEAERDQLKFRVHLQPAK